VKTPAADPANPGTGSEPATPGAGADPAVGTDSAAHATDPGTTVPQDAQVADATVGADAATTASDDQT
jgi:hypothetical protein